MLVCENTKLELAHRIRKNQESEVRAYAVSQEHDETVMRKKRQAQICC